jgi:hypothetical protein
VKAVNLRFSPSWTERRERDHDYLKGLRHFCRNPHNRYLFMFGVVMVSWDFNELDIGHKLVSASPGILGGVFLITLGLP